MILPLVPVGLVSGLLGAGGSILAIPLLTYALGLKAKQAVATSLGVVGSGAFFAMLHHARHHQVRFKLGLTFGLTGAGAWIGAQLSRSLRIEPILTEGTPPPA